MAAKKKKSDEQYVDPAITPYEKALKAMFGGKFEQAHKLFTQAEEQAEQSDLAARARTFALACQQRIDGPADADDPFLEAVVAKNDGDLETAFDMCSRGGRKGKDERFAYLAASVAALQGNVDDALAGLQSAIEMNPENRIHAHHDPDFDDLRDNEAFQEILHPEEQQIA